MALSLLEIAQTALREIGQFAVPSSIVNNSDPTAVQLLALANRTVREIAYDYKWQALLQTHTFSTAIGTADYAVPTGVPTGFKSFANLTQWDRTNLWQVDGPVSPIDWEALRSGQIVATWQKYFRLAADSFSIYPTPTAVETIAYQYYSKYCVAGSKERFELDADTPVVDDDLVTLGLRWRWLAAKGVAYDDVAGEYALRLSTMQAMDGGKSALYFGRRPWRSNLPETNYGS